MNDNNTSGPNNIISLKYNFFLSIKNEIEWLNKLGKQGLLLTKKSFMSYTFERTDNKYEYDVFWLDSSPETPENVEFIAKKESEGCKYCGRRSCFVYFSIPTETGIIAEPEKIKLMRNRFFTLSVFWLLLSGFLCGLLIYNYTWINKFKNIDYVIKANDKKLVFFKKFLTGKNPAQMMFILVLPVAAVALSYFIIYIFEYLAWNKTLKNYNESAE